MVVSNSKIQNALQFTLSSSTHLQQAMDSITYHTHDNGGRPYRVVIKNDTDVTVYHEYGTNPQNAVFEQSVAQVFIGKSPICRMTTWSGGHGPRFDGNSILLRLTTDKLEYLFIGHRLIRFMADAV